MKPNFIRKAPTCAVPRRLVSHRVNTIVTEDSNKSFNHRIFVVASAIEFLPSRVDQQASGASEKKSSHGAQAIESFEFETTLSLAHNVRRDDECNSVPMGFVVKESERQTNKLARSNCVIKAFDGGEIISLNNLLVAQNVAEIFPRLPITSSSSHKASPCTIYHLQLLATKQHNFSLSSSPAPCFTWCWNALWNLIMWCDAMLLSYMLSFFPFFAPWVRKTRWVNKQLFKWLFRCLGLLMPHVVQHQPRLVIPSRLSST